MMNNKILRLIRERTIIKKGYRKFFKFLIEPVCSKMVVFFPIKGSRIVFDNFGGKGFGDNPRYIAEKIHIEAPDLELIWLVDNLANYKFPGYIVPVKIDSIEGLYMRATAKVWIDNIRHLHPVKKRSGQIYLQTWHAPFSPKRLEEDAKETLGDKYISEARYDGSICDAILANSKLQEEQYKRAFWLNSKTEILKFGLPRNDYLAISKDNQGEYRRLRKKFGFNNGDIYILYAPTFRDDFSTDGYNIDYYSVLSAFENLVKKDCHMVVRFHPNVSNQAALVSFNEKVINGTNIPDIQELSVACDMVISDYSTSLFDFALLNKPAFICALDLEHYKEIRGLLPEFEDFPFPKATTNNSFVDLVENFNLEEYQNRTAEYFDKYPLYDTGNATQQVAIWILNRMGR